MFLLWFIFFLAYYLKLRLPLLLGLIDHPLPLDIFGFNGANTIQPDQSWNDILENQAPLTRLQDLNARVLRYPGGTLGNYWDWRKGWFLSQHDLQNGILLPEKFNPELPNNSGTIVFDDKLETFLECLSHSNAKPM